MRLTPQSRRPLILLALGAALIGWVLWKQHLPTRVYDRRDVLSDHDRTNLNTFTAALMNESGVDVRIVLDSLPPGTVLEQHALAEARRLGMGQTSDKRGLLLDVDLASGDLRIEVGRHLEGIFPDAFLGRMLRTHTRAALADTSLAMAIQTTLMLVQHRLREAALNQDYDPRITTAIEDSVTLASGGGAQLRVAHEDPLRFKGRSTPALDSMLAPATSAEAALAGYEAWLGLPACVTTVPLLTEDSRDYLTNEFPMTQGWWRYWQYVERGRVRRLVVRGDRAVAYPTEDPLAGPWFFWRTRAGWQVDLMAEMINTRNISGSDFAWTLVRSGDAYDRAFGDLYQESWPFWRFKDGANRGLAWRGKIE